MPLTRAVGELGGRHAAKAAVLMHGVVVGPPCLNDPPRRSQRVEEMLVQALAAQATIEALDKAILLRAFDKLRSALPGAMECRSPPVSWH